MLTNSTMECRFSAVGRRHRLLCPSVSPWDLHCVFGLTTGRNRCLTGSSVGRRIPFVQLCLRHSDPLTSCVTHRQRRRPARSVHKKKIFRNRFTAKSSHLYQSRRQPELLGHTQRDDSEKWATNQNTITYFENIRIVTAKEWTGVLIVLARSANYHRLLVELRFLFVFRNLYGGI